jgi:hypothetical protein
MARACTFKKEGPPIRSEAVRLRAFFVHAFLRGKQYGMLAGLCRRDFIKILFTETSR